MRLSVLIVNWNTRDLLRACLQSLDMYPASGGQEVIVVDNASSDDSAEMVKCEFPNVKLIASDKNLGYAAGNNTAIKAATGDYLLLLNPDTEIKPDSLDRAIEYFKTHPQVGAVGVKLIYPNGNPQSSCRSFPTPLAVMWEYLGFSRLFPKSKVFGAYRMTWFNYNEEIEVDQPMGTFLLIPGYAMDAVGLMDEDFPIFFNDVDWCKRAKKSGWKIMFLPNIEIIHHGGESTRQVKKAMIWESHRSLLCFYRKHYSPLWRLLLAPIVYANAFIRARGWDKGFVGS